MVILTILFTDSLTKPFSTKSSGGFRPISKLMYSVHFLGESAKQQTETIHQFVAVMNLILPIS